jgi:S-adenosylmethionine-diacylglycerol 3-amino-3-carboxypropyl transferase
MPKSGSRILSIGSAGDNSFSLLLNNPQLVVAVDINPIQLYLIELKKACFLKLDREETLAFLGFNESLDRLALLSKIETELSDEAATYWRANSELLKLGIISQGKFEKYFISFSKKILPLIHSKKKTLELLRPKDKLKQELYYQNSWNTWRWRLLFKIFFSKYVMGRFGRDPEFLREVNLTVSDYIFNKAEKHLKSTQAKNNFMLRFNLTGNFGDLLPHYLEASNYAVIKANIHNLIIRKGYAEDVIKEFGTFDSMNLSNIFEYMPKEVFSQTARKLQLALNKGGRMAYWNLMVPRSVSEVFPEALVYKKELSEKLTNDDRGFFYNQFIVDEKL